MSHVTPETAKRIKDAGFPQPPDSEEERLWYDSYGNLIFLGHTVDGHLEPIEGGDCFAPTATDILAHLPGWYLSFEDGIWFCSLQEDEFVLAEFRSSNPAEAAAEAWFFEQSNAKK